MKGNEFLEKMELIDPAYVEAAEMKPEKRRTEWVKWMGAAACLCIVATVAFTLPWERSTNDISYVEPTISGDLVNEIEVEKNHPENEIGVGSTNSAVGLTVPDTTPVTEPVLEPDFSGTHSGTVYTPNNMEAVDVIPMISSYGQVTYVPGTTVADGEILFSESLTAAMEHHGDDVNYRVLIEFFRGNAPMSSGGQTALDEMNRLSDLGYIVAFETVVKTKEKGEYIEAETEYYFTIHATYEQLQNFAANENLGYLIMLYDEYFGGAQPLDRSTVFYRTYVSGN